MTTEEDCLKGCSTHSRAGAHDIRCEYCLYGALIRLCAKFDKLEVDLHTQLEEARKGRTHADFVYDLIGDDGEIVRNPEAPSTGGDQQPEQRQDPLRWGGSREVPHSSRVLPYEGGAG